MIRLLTLLLLTCCVPTPAHAAGPLVFIDGVITDGSVTPVRAYFEKRLQSDDKTAIDVLIDSPGGGVIAGMSLVNQMQNLARSGVNINCYVMDMAASMAFQLLTACTHRTALASSFLLWHGVRVQTREAVTAESAQALVEGLRQMDDLILSQLNGELDLSEVFIRHNFDRETLWSGLTLHSVDPKFIDLMTAFPEVLKRVPTSIRTKAPSLFDFFGTDGEGEGYQYIWNDWQHKHQHQMESTTWNHQTQ